MYVGAATAETGNPKVTTVKPISNGRLHTAYAAEARAASPVGVGCWALVSIERLP